MRPTVDATRRQYSSSAANVGYRSWSEIHLHAVDQLFELHPRQVELANERLERAALRRSGCAAVRGVELGAPGAELVLGMRALAPQVSDSLPIRSRHHLVHRIVNRAAEVPDGDDRAAACAAAGRETSSRSSCRGS